MNRYIARMAERSKASDLSSDTPWCAWVRIPLLAFFLCLTRIITIERHSSNRRTESPWKIVHPSTPHQWPWKKSVGGWLCDPHKLLRFTEMLLTLLISNVFYIMLKMVWYLGVFPYGDTPSAVSRFFRRRGHQTVTQHPSGKAWSVRKSCWCSVFKWAPSEG